MVFSTALFWKLYTILRQKEHTRQEITNFSFKIFKINFFRSSKKSKATWNSPEQPHVLTQKLEKGKTAPHLWYSYVVTNVGLHYVVIIDGF